MTMTEDFIVEEIHAIRDALSKEAGDDIYRIAKAAQERQRASTASHEVVSLPARKAQQIRRATLIPR